MAYLTTMLSTFFLVFVEFGQRCCCMPVQQSSSPNRTPSYPLFMENLYHHLVRNGKFQFCDIVHSNTALDVKKSSISFRAMFSDLGFTKTEILKRAQLRLSVLGLNQCTAKFTLHLRDGETNQILDTYNHEAKTNGVNSVLLTSSLKKLALTSSRNKTLRLEIFADQSTQSQCSDVVRRLSSEAYLVSDTEEKTPRRRRRGTQVHSGRFDRLRRDSWRLRRDCISHPIGYDRIVKRSAACSKILWSVDLNNTGIYLPHAFTTGVCTGQYDLPVNGDSIRMQVVNRVHQVMQSVPGRQSTSSLCCKPTKYRQLPVLYQDSTSHYLLRSLDDIVVTQCGCPNETSD